MQALVIRASYSSRHWADGNGASVDGTNKAVDGLYSMDGTAMFPCHPSNMPCFHAILPIHDSHPPRWMGLPATTRGAEPSESYMKKKLRCFTRLRGPPVTTGRAESSSAPPSYMKKQLVRL
jgi:hypothetical protein